MVVQFLVGTKLQCSYQKKNAMFGMLCAAYCLLNPFVVATSLDYLLNGHIRLDTQCSECTGIS